MRRVVLERVQRPRVQAAQRMGGTITKILAALNSDRPSNALARHQLAAIRQRVVEMEKDLAERDAAGLVADDIVDCAARTTRALWKAETNAARGPAYLARALDICARLAVGLTPVGHEGEEIEAARLAVRSSGVGPTALAMFALTYPDLAVRIDRRSLDRLVVAWTDSVEGGRWPVIASVWKERIGVHVAAISIKNEVAKLSKAIRP